MSGFDRLKSILLFAGAMDGPTGVKLARGIQIRVLAHLNVGFGPLSLHVFKHASLPTVPRLHPLLRPLENSQQPLGAAADASELCGLSGRVEPQELPLQEGCRLVEAANQRDSLPVERKKIGPVHVQATDHGTGFGLQCQSMLGRGGGLLMPDPVRAVPCAAMRAVLQSADMPFGMVVAIPRRFSWYGRSLVGRRGVVGVVGAWC